MLCIVANFFTHECRERKGILSAAMREFEGSGTADTEPYAEWLAFVGSIVVAVCFVQSFFTQSALP